MTSFKAYAAREAGGRLEPFEYELGDLGPDEVDVRVEYCGICHSDLSMLDNEWGISQYPLVPGHEVVGTVAAKGSTVTNLAEGQRVGLGWMASSCGTCVWCLGGDLNLCRQAIPTIVGRHGGFADRVRARQSWVIPLPEGLDPAKAGPLFCGGITVFSPILQHGLRAVDRVGVLGIGGLGHLALQFLSAWGCEVTAFSSTPDKEAEARSFGATGFVNSRDPEAMQAIAGQFDLIVSTVAVDLDWNAYIAALRPKGRLHFVGVVPSPLEIPVFSLIEAQKTVTASPIGSPKAIADMLEFAARKNIAPVVEPYPFSQVNEAMDRLRNGKPRYRIVLHRDGAIA